MVFNEKTKTANYVTGLSGSFWLHRKELYAKLQFIFEISNVFG